VTTDETGLAWWQRHLLWTRRQAVAIGLAGILLVLAVVLIFAVT
jgi:hypothetical protein